MNILISSIEYAYMRFFDWLIGAMKTFVLLSPLAVVVVALGMFVLWLLCLLGDWIDHR